MCSSPKSSGSVSKRSTRSIFASMDPETRKKFVATANKAQERKEQRLEKQKQMKMNTQANRNSKRNTQNNTKNNSKSAIKQTGLLAMLSMIGFSV